MESSVDHVSEPSAETHRRVAAMRRHWWYRGRRVLVRRLLGRAEVAHHGRVLDVGCGTGHMGATLSRYGEVVGVEASTDALAAGDYTSYSEIAQAGGVADSAFPTGRFGLIALLDVLEHVEDDSALLAELAVRLTPGGIFLVSVPMWPELFGEEDRMAGHYRRYTPDTLETAARDAGLRVRTRTGYVVALLPLARAQRRRVAAGKASASDELEVPFGPVNSAMSLVSMAEGWVSGAWGLPAGLSLFALLERSGGEGLRSAEDAPS